MNVRILIRQYGLWGAFVLIESTYRRKVNPLMPLWDEYEVLTWWGQIAERIEYYNVVIRYKHKVEVRPFNHEADNWCDENCNGKWIYHSQAWLDCGPYYRFKDEIDAVAFKLRWL